MAAPNDEEQRKYFYKTADFLVGVTVTLLDLETDGLDRFKTTDYANYERSIKYMNAFLSDGNSFLNCVSQMTSAVKECPEDLLSSCQDLQSVLDIILSQRNAVLKRSIYESCQEKLEHVLNVLSQQHNVSVKDLKKMIEKVSTWPVIILIATRSKLQRLTEYGEINGNIAIGLYIPRVFLILW